MVYRKIKYEFSEEVLRLPTIQTSLVFGVGPRELEEFRMIERHYFRDQLVKSYDFTFGFVIPNSTNTWDAVYSLPPMDDDLISDMVASPYETSSDSFYFVGDELVMHNKAEYKYIPESMGAGAKPSGGGASYKGGGSKGSKGGGGGAEGKGYKGSKNIGFDEEAASHKWSKDTDYY
jgi:hypothetical protein